MANLPQAPEGTDEWGALEDCTCSMCSARRMGAKVFVPRKKKKKSQNFTVPPAPFNLNGDIEKPFDGRPYVAGSLLGLRTLLVSGDALISPAQIYTWYPGENKAICAGTVGGGMMFTVTYNPQTGQYIRTIPSTTAPGAGHRPATLNCSCGFYAYTNGENTYYTDPEFHVGAVIEGYGVVTQGAKGFRCEKAKIVALFAADELIQNAWGTLRQYDVPIYTSQEAMLAQHPLTPPEQKETVA